LRVRCAGPLPEARSRPRRPSRRWPASARHPTGPFGEAPLGAPGLMGPWVRAAPHHPGDGPSGSVASPRTRRGRAGAPAGSRSPGRGARGGPHPFGPRRPRPTGIAAGPNGHDLSGAVLAQDHRSLLRTGGHRGLCADRLGKALANGGRSPKKVPNSPMRIPILAGRYGGDAPSQRAEEDGSLRRDRGGPVSVAIPSPVPVGGSGATYRALLIGKGPRTVRPPRRWLSAWSWNTGSCLDRRTADHRRREHRARDRRGGARGGARLRPRSSRDSFTNARSSIGRLRSHRFSSRVPAPGDGSR
jgi:hypothetical protein